jgi:ATP-dependent DNA helicase DinG
MARYELRPGQLQMARAVQRALASGQVLLCEAGTGTGKTLAYLVAAILSRQKVVVSTATRALQDQIFSQDLPLIEGALGLEPRAALMKGLANYVCRRRYAEFAASPEAHTARFTSALAALERWLGRTETGDFSEIDELEESDPIFAEVAASSDTRVGAACPFYADCFITKMKRRADAARILVVNHHLFFADLVLRGPHPGKVIPDYDAAIFDEAHQLEDIATVFFGLQLSSGQLERVVSDAERALLRARAAGAGGAQDSLRQLLAHVRSAAVAFWQQLRAEAPSEVGRVTLEREVWAGSPQQVWHVLDADLEALGASVQTAYLRLGAQSPSPSERESRASLRETLAVVERRTDQVRQQLCQIIEGAAGMVSWFEPAERRATLGCSAVDVSAVLRQQIFESIPSVVLTSATLATSYPDGGEGCPATLAGELARSPFAFLRSRLGLTGADIAVTELVVPSPFDFERRALLYIPRDLPPPTSRGFVAAAIERVAELVELTRGGALVLATSLRSMRALANGLREQLLGYPVLVQGEAPKRTLLDELRRSGDAVLVATMGFWHGVDIPGPSLRLVVLEKIPFAVPTDPVVRARSLALEQSGQSAFMHLAVPAAAITLKQGFGRLIRTRADRGIVALFDERIHRRGYAGRILAALPPAARTTELEAVRRFWAGADSPGASG